MSTRADEEFLASAYDAFNTNLAEGKYDEAQKIVRGLRDKGFIADSIHLWERLYKKQK